MLYIILNYWFIMLKFVNNYFFNKGYIFVTCPYNNIKSIVKSSNVTPICDLIVLILIILLFVSFGKYLLDFTH